MSPLPFTYCQLIQEMTNTCSFFLEIQRTANPNVSHNFTFYIQGAILKDYFAHNLTAE